MNRRHHGFQPCALPAELPRLEPASLAAPESAAPASGRRAGEVSLRGSMRTRIRPVAVIGAGLDLGAGRRGVDMGPSAIRYAGLQERIAGLGRACVDWGDVEAGVPEATEEGDPQARYLGAIMRSCARVAGLVGEACEAGHLPLVLGGDHSVAMGTLGGMARVHGARRRPLARCPRRPQPSRHLPERQRPRDAAGGRTRGGGRRLRDRRLARARRSSGPPSSASAPSTRASAS